jgi:2-polyprenyl-3-methyl-5-hydroxy-6-metoxy-1,4-benzoquinol methylase
MNNPRVDKTLFTGDHYLGKPADEEDRIVTRRIEILQEYKNFFCKDCTLLEIGCGNGATVSRLASLFTKAVGIDLYDYAKAFERTREKYRATNSQFEQVDLESGSYVGQYDRIISFEVIEHFKTEATVAKFYSLLKPGGMAAISVPNKWWIFETHGARLPLLQWNRVPFFSWLPTPIHERYANARIYTRGRIISLMKRSGFSVIDTRYITAPMDVLKDGPLKRFLLKYVFGHNTTRIPMLSTSIFILVQKPAA